MSRLTAMHTPSDLADLANGLLPDDEATLLMRTVKRGVTPAQLAALRAAVQTERLLALVDIDQASSAPTQADRIEDLLTQIVLALEHQNARLSAIERALGRHSG